MRVQLSRRVFLRLLTAFPVGATAGCGTILYPERRNQPPGGRLDWGVVALDTIGLIFFFIPGVIAFAVDFTTGAIYLPPPGYTAYRPSTPVEELVALQIPKEELSNSRIETVASAHSGRSVRLVEGRYKTRPLAKIADFWPTWARFVNT